MSARSQSPAVPSDQESSSGFKTFWKKSNKAAQSQDLTFVPQGPASFTKGGRVRRLFKTGSTTGSSTTDETRSSGQTDAQKRRDQVYQAQKRHRNRKAEYIQSLEEEVARLQHLDALVNNEKSTLAYENRTIRAFLESQSLDANLEKMDLTSTADTTQRPRPSPRATVDIRFDPEMNHERTYLDLDGSSMIWTPTNLVTTAPVQQPAPQPTTQSAPQAESSRSRHEPPSGGDSWAALDFILALEWPCRDHVHHPFINPAPLQPESRDPEAMHGHALTTTAAVLQRSLPPPQLTSATAQLSPSIPLGTTDSPALERPDSPHWQLPHSEIDKLVKLSEDLQLDDDLLTPAQAYSAVRARVADHDPSLLRPVLEALKKPLGSLMQCHGFGAGIETQMFWEQLSNVIQI